MSFALTFEISKKLLSILCGLAVFLVATPIEASEGASCMASLTTGAEALALTGDHHDQGWIAIVNGVSSGKRYVEVAKERGFKVLHISTYANNEFPRMWASSFNAKAYDELLEFDGADPEALLARLKELGVRAILPGCDEAPPVAEFLASSLGLSTNGFDHEDRLAFLENPRRNKFYQNETLSAYLEGLRSQGVDLPGRVAHQIGAHSWAEAYHWKRQVYPDWPVIAKPVLSSGQDDIFKCFDMACLKRAFEHIMGRTNKHGHQNQIVQIQEFLEGQEYIIETASADGEHEFVYAWRYDAVPVPGTSALTHVADLLPVDHALDPRFFEFAKILNEGLGIRVGSAHYEMFLTVNNEVVLVETAPRMAGGDMPHWAKEALLVDEANLNIDAYTQPRLFFERLQWIRSQQQSQVLKTVSEVLLLSHSDDQRADFSAETDIRALESFRSLSWRYAEGEALEVSTNLDNVIAYVILMHEDPDVVEHDKALLKQWEQESRFSSAP